MKLINLMPVDVRLFGTASVTTFPYEGKVARIAEVRNPAPIQIDGVNEPVHTYRQDPAQVQNLPPEDKTGRVGYIVSSMVRTTLHWRKDLFTPAQLLRSPENGVQGCRAFLRNG
jgi:hypothetical protein